MFLSKVLTFRGLIGPAPSPDTRMPIKKLPSAAGSVTNTPQPIKSLQSDSESDYDEEDEELINEDDEEVYDFLIMDTKEGLTPKGDNKQFEEDVRDFLDSSSDDEGSEEEGEIYVNNRCNKMNNVNNA